ncbi:MAG: hypothetical protein NTW90_02495 [Nitrosospira sp.]|nr:hypothetical protein [Nitrosospira sp.]
MLPPLRAIILTILTAALFGCASFEPRYQITHRYEPPTDPAGIACLGNCTQQLAACQQSCTSTYQACLQRIEPLAEQRYDEAVKRFESESSSYRQQLNGSRFYQSLGWGRSAWGWGGSPWGWGPGWGWGGSPWYGMGYSSPYFYSPAPPIRPDRRREYDRLRYEQCEVECGCQSVQDACFLSCGGKKTVEERCIANCPK